ncbi:MAG TPA: redoxin family protein [Bryobacteraceae bacterium]|jgi:thiol-disulfide isomerase/thioredoxin|nr:redoxin family protein [Bryobacteraceae bacterium]
MRSLALLFLPALFAQTPQPDPRELLLRSADAIKKYSSYQIHSLSIIETRGGTNTRMQMPAVISVRRPDRMRIESETADAATTVVSDGSHTYVYLEKENKYIKRAATSSPESSLGENGVLKNLPDIANSIKSIEITGEKTMELDDQQYECWVVEAHYDTIKVPGQNLTILDAVQTSWISKTLGLTLQNSLTARLLIGTLPEPVVMTQATTTVSLSLNTDLPDSLFTFTPPPGATQTADWTLPGITKPDIEGKPAPSLKGAPPTQGKVVLLDFWTSWCTPCKRQQPIIEKLNREFRSKGLIVLGVNVGEDKDAMDKVHLAYPSLQLDADDEALKSLAVNAYPTLVLIDRTGKVAFYDVGAKSEASLRAALAKTGIRATPAPPKPAAAK